MKKIKYIVLSILLAFSFNSYAEIEENILENYSEGEVENLIELETLSDVDNVDLFEEGIMSDFDMESFYRDTILNSTYIYYY
jgi:hypothetical protein